MIISKSTKPLFILAAIVLSALVLSGCYRQSISSSPPRNQPVKVVADAPAPEAAPEGKAEPMEEMSFEDGSAKEETKAAAEAKTEEVKEEVVAQQVIIEETYEVDAPKEDFNRIQEPKETELEAEPVAAPVEVAVAPAAAPVAAEAATPAPEAVTEPADLPEPVEEVDPVEMAAAGPVYYVQVGAFTDPDAANSVLEALKTKGFANSRTSTSLSGLVKVQAGTFTDKPAAREALDTLMAEFKDAFIVKSQ